MCLLQGLCFEHVLYPWRHAFLVFITSERSGVVRVANTPNEGSMHFAGITAVVRDCIDPEARKRRGPHDDRPVAIFESVNLTEGSHAGSPYPCRLDRKCSQPRHQTSSSSVRA